VRYAAEFGQAAQFGLTLGIFAGFVFATLLTSVRTPHL
jgi:hypothetical protein